MDEDGPVAERSVWTAFLALTVIAGGNFVVVRFSNAELAPFWGAFLRFGVASFVLFWVAAVRRIPMPHGRALVGAAIYGALGFGLSYAFAYWALLGLKSGLLAVLVSTTPLITFLLALAVGLEKFRWPALGGSLLALAGVAVILREQLNLHVPWQFLLGGLLGAFCIASSGVVAKWFPRGHPVATNAVGMGVGSAVLILLSIVVNERRVVPQRATTLLAVAYLILVGSVLMFGLFLYVLGHWTASATSYQLVLSPIVTVLVAAWLVHETPTWTFLVGALIVLIGVYVGAVRRSPVKPAPVGAASPQNAESTIGARGP